MTDSRSHGLYQLQGAIMLLALPLFFSICYHLSVQLFDRFSYHTMDFPLYIAGCVIASAISFKFYHRLSFAFDPFKIPRVIDISNRQSITLLIVMTFLIFATKDKGMSRVFMGTFIASSWFFFFLTNLFLIRVLPQRVFTGENLRSCLLIGSSASCNRVESWLLSKSAIGLDVVGFLSFDNDEEVPTKIPLLGTVANLENVLKAKKINQVVLLTSNNSKEWVHQVLNTCQKQTCRLLVYNSWSEYFSHALVAIQAGPHTFFSLKPEPLENPFNRILKRILDISLALAICILILPSLALAVWIAHRLQSPGPLLFKQRRCGLNGKEFIIYKFRSMHIYDKHEEGKQATKADKRIFGFGKIIRRFSIDEFPQFINVLQGHMSLVGPRPHYIEHDKLFKQHIPDYNQRFFAKPGVSGLAQVKGFRGEITDIDVLKNRIHYDLEYIDNWSLALDITIILRSIWAMFFPAKSAY